jgi:hypothetical protein
VGAAGGPRSSTRNPQRAQSRTYPQGVDDGVGGLGFGPMLPSMTTPDLGRKVRQLDNDVQAIYEMLAGISATQHRQGNRLEEIVAEQATHREKLEEILHLLRNGQVAGGEGIRPHAAGV